jgi:hypothetical protein
MTLGLLSTLKQSPFQEFIINIETYVLCRYFYDIAVEKKLCMYEDKVDKKLHICIKIKPSRVDNKIMKNKINMHVHKSNTVSGMYIRTNSICVLISYFTPVHVCKLALLTSRTGIRRSWVQITPGVDFMNQF